MANLFFAPTANYVQTTLNGSITAGVTTITLNSTTNMNSPGYVVIDRQDGSGNNTPSAREVVYFTGISGSNLTGCTRGADGSTAASHANGALVETMPTVGMWNSLASAAGTVFTADGVIKAVVSPVSVSQLNISTYMNASGASILGSFVSSKIIASTRDLTAASGDVSYTGVGFKPTSIICFAGVSPNASMSIGYSDSAAANRNYSRGANGNFNLQSNIASIEPTVAGDLQTAIIKTYDTDGFTLTWTKAGVPTGTATLVFLCYK